MAINTRFAFGSTAAEQGAKSGKSELPKAQFWLNVGYQSEVPDSEGTFRFISLPVGIPLDSQDSLATNSRNAEFAAFQSARNDLMYQIMELTNSLAPGEERMVNLQLQLRRVNSEAPAVSVKENPFTKKLDL